MARAWDFTTITPEERAEFQALDEARADADLAGEYDKVRELEAQINAFIDRMTAKYTREENC